MARALRRDLIEAGFPVDSRRSSMKKWTTILAVFVATLIVASGAMAQGAGGSGAGTGSGAGAAASGGTGAGGSGATGAAGSPSAGGGAVGTPGTPTTSGSDRSKAETPPGTPTTGTSASGSVTSPSASGSAGHATMSGDFTGRHTMEGEVVRIDQRKGHVTLKTAEGNMQLHFPPSALAQVKKGDRMAVELAMKPAGSASMKNDTKGSASPRTDDTKKK
jgi:hypothetical protein